MKVLMVDGGGSGVKLMNAPDCERRRFPSGRTLTAAEMVHSVRSATVDWAYDAVSIGFPGLICDGMPAREPPNLGDGWVNFDYSKAFERPVRFINDAAMQALGNYVRGRLHFLGLGTSIGATIIVDDVVIPIEVGLIKLARKQYLVDRVSKAALKRDGAERWLEAVRETVDLLRDVFYPDETVLGGGNSELIRPLPEGCRQVNNESAFAGARRLWEGADLIARPARTSWKIVRG